MSIKSNITKIIRISCWVIASMGLLILLGAAMRRKKESTCKGYEINIHGSGEEQWFIDKKDVAEILTKNGEWEISGKDISSFDLKRMEDQLEKEVWIKEVELFFDNTNMLQISISERVPVARIFTTQGYSYYVDSSCTVLPLSDKMSARLPVFTGFPSARPGKRDSSFLRDIVNMSSYILKDPFWMAQLAQIDIDRNRQYELIPMIGDHVIEFGQSHNYQDKLNRLKIFYQQVLAKRGINIYSVIKLQYDGQVVGVRNPRFASRADSATAMKNIEKLIESGLPKLEPAKAASINTNKQSTNQNFETKQRIPKAVMKASGN